MNGLGFSVLSTPIAEHVGNFLDPNWSAFDGNQHRYVATVNLPVVSTEFCHCLLSITVNRNMKENKLDKFGLVE